MQAAIGLPDDVTRGPPVLLIHGTDSTTQMSWPTTYMPALTDAGFAVFTVDLPSRALADIQDSSEYVVYALRAIHALTGQKVSMIAHSQGGLEERWALRWWPTVRALVDDVISLGTPQHGTQVANLNCAFGCAPPHWQMQVGSQFLDALNRDDETPGDLDYTSIYSGTDELVQPQLPDSTSALDGAINVLVQSICPGHPVNHVALMRDPVVFTLVLDALNHAGGADPSRVSASTCTALTIPGVDPVAQFHAEEAFAASFTDDSADYNSDGEPPLRDYAR